MNIRCIYCKIDELGADLSDEHIIPQVLGGWLTIPVVCKEHNDRFGHSLESELKKNGFIATALDKLQIQPPNLAYREAETRIDLEYERGLKGHIDEKGSAKFFPQVSKEGHRVIPEDQTINVLKKQIERFENKTGKSINFDLEEFDNLPYDIAIPVYGTDIIFIKRKAGRGNVIMYGLDQPIPFRVIAKIVLTHLAALYYPFVMKDEFDPIKGYIVHGGINRFIILHTLLRNVEPKSVNYLPYHYIRINFVEGALAAIIALFGAIKFMIFFEEFESIDEFKPVDFLNNYHVYNIKNKNIFHAVGDDKLREWDDMLLRSVVVWGKYMKDNLGVYTK
ncbi:MAG: HNH endonuclease [Deltaproteobacteria bacterium]|nr:HNH endonuclease [Deltaproteobacteria bacterium]